METEREPLKCGHPWSGQGRCGMCDRCYDGCCTCNRKAEAERKIRVDLDVLRAHLQPEQTAPGASEYTNEHGRVRDRVVCACGATNLFYRWSWAGHGKAKCCGCGGWICFRTKELIQNGQ